MPNKPQATLIKVYELDKVDYDYLVVNGGVGPVCHWGGLPNELHGHVVSRKMKWADLKVGPKGNKAIGCLDHMKQYYPEAFLTPAPAVEKVQPQVKVCTECEEILPEDPTLHAAFKCDDCEYLAMTDDYDQYTLRECSNDNCGTKFVAQDGNNCPDCNRPFTRKLAEVGCTECNEGEMQEVKVIECESCQALVEP